MRELGGPHLVSGNAPQNTCPSSRLPSTCRSLTVNSHDPCWPLGFSPMPLPEATGRFAVKPIREVGYYRTRQTPFRIQCQRRSCSKPGKGKLGFSAFLAKTVIRTRLCSPEGTLSQERRHKGRRPHTSLVVHSQSPPRCHHPVPCRCRPQSLCRTKNPREHWKSQRRALCTMSRAR